MLVTIYSIVCKTNPELVYVGSTQDYDRRKSKHKIESKINTQKVYELIRSNGGWDNFVMTPIKHFECDTRQQACEEEDKYIVEMKATMNTNRAVMCPERVKKYKIGWKDSHKKEIKEYRKKYRIDRLQECKEQNKKYYQNHKAEIQEKNKKKYTCVCGKKCQIIKKTQHEKSQFHVRFLTTIIPVSTMP